MKNAVSIHIDIAELVFVVSKIPQDKKADWLDSFVESLALKNCKNEFAVKLLNDVEEYQRIKGEKASKSAMMRWHKEQYANACERMQSDTGACERMQSDTGACDVMRIDANDAKEQRREDKIRKEKNKEKDTIVSKKKFGESGKVFLKDEEYQKLVATFGETATEDKIQNLENYILSKGKKYASHYHTILNWERKDSKQSKQHEQESELEFVPAN